jgi:hypothetical protein
MDKDVSTTITQQTSGLQRFPISQPQS